MNHTSIDKSWTHLIAADMPIDDFWEFATALNRETGATFHTIWSDGRAQVPRIIRWARYIAMAVRLIRHRSHLQVVVCWQQFFAVLYAFLCSLLRLAPTTQVIALTVIIKPRAGFIGVIQRWVLRRALRSGHIRRAVVYNPAEIGAYSSWLNVDAGIFAHIPLALHHMPPKDLNIGDDGFYFATGKSNRDYSLLLHTLADTAHQVVIACDTLPQPAASNITVVHDAFDDDMLRIMCRARAVIITLNDPYISSGQLVALQAMALKKPLIVTQGDALSHYVTHGDNALVIEKTPYALINAVVNIDNNLDLRLRLSTNGHKRFQQNHTLQAMAHNLREACGDLS